MTKDIYHAVSVVHTGLVISISLIAF